MPIHKLLSFLLFLIQNRIRWKLPSSFDSIFLENLFLSRKCSRRGNGPFVPPPPDYVPGLCAVTLALVELTKSTSWKRKISPSSQTITRSSLVYPKTAGLYPDCPACLPFVLVCRMMSFLTPEVSQHVSGLLTVILWCCGFFRGCSDAVFSVLLILFRGSPCLCAGVYWFSVESVVVSRTVTSICVWLICRVYGRFCWHVHLSDLCGVFCSSFRLCCRSTVLWDQWPCMSLTLRCMPQNGCHWHSLRLRRVDNTTCLESVVEYTTRGQLAPRGREGRCMAIFENLMKWYAYHREDGIHQAHERVLELGVIGVCHLWSVPFQGHMGLHAVRE